MNKLYSFWLLFIIQLQRSVDHAWRSLTGFPTLKRSVITPNLYLGGQYKISRLSFLKNLGITGIVNMRMTILYKEDILSGFNVLNLPTEDQHPPSMNQLNKGIKFIENIINKSGKVYIHCKHGEGRGPTMAIAYLIYSGMTYDDAYTLVKKIRTFIRPSQAQIERLKEFEQWISIQRNRK